MNPVVRSLHIWEVSLASYHLPVWVNQLLHSSTSHLLNACCDFVSEGVSFYLCEICVKRFPVFLCAKQKLTLVLIHTAISVLGLTTPGKAKCQMPQSKAIHIHPFYSPLSSQCLYPVHILYSLKLMTPTLTNIHCLFECSKPFTA